MKNTYSTHSFITLNIYGYVLAWFWYKALLFRSIEGVSFTKSVLLLLSTLVSSFLIGYITQFRSRKNLFSVAINALIGYGMYTLVSYLPINKSLVVVVVPCVCMSVLLYALKLFARKKDNDAPSKRFRNKLSIFVRGSQTIIATGMIVMMLVPCLSVNITSGIAQAKTATPSISTEDTIANNIDYLIKLENEEWNYMSVDEKLDVLQTVANIERRYLGIPHELNVVAKDMEDSSTLGCYQERTYTIFVSTASIMYDEAFEVVDTICHESYHAYQFCLVEMYHECSDKYKELKLNRRSRLYLEEFSDYISGYEDYYAYYDQACEEDAREYAKSATNDYYAKIHEYSNTELSRTQAKYD